MVFIYALQNNGPQKSHTWNKMAPNMLPSLPTKIFFHGSREKTTEMFSNPKKCQVQLLKWHILTFWALRARFQTRTCPKKPGRLRRDGQIHRPPVRWD